jgi:hypothetical protein
LHFALVDAAIHHAFFDACSNLLNHSAFSSWSPPFLVFLLTRRRHSLPNLKQNHSKPVLLHYCAFFHCECTSPVRPAAPNNSLNAAMADHCRKHAMQKPSQAKQSKQAKNEMERRNKTKQNKQRYCYGVNII